MGLKDHIDLKKVGERIALQRIYKGWSQNKLASEMRIKHSQVWAWEKGAGISEMSLKKLAVTLGTNVKFLVSGIDPTIDTILIRDTPREYPDHLRAATKLWVTGLNLSRILPNEESIIQDICAKPLGQVKVVLLDPDDENACRYGAAQEYGDADSWKEYQSTIILARNFLRTFNASKLEYKLVHYPLSFGLDIINFGYPDSFLYVRHYPIRNSRFEMPKGNEKTSKYEKVADQPIIRFDSRTPEHEYWYNFYLRQFFTVWAVKDGWPSAPQPITA